VKIALSYNSPGAFAPTPLTLRGVKKYSLPLILRGRGGRELLTFIFLTNQFSGLSESLKQNPECGRP
jgi:hypothetical protein